MYLRDLEFFIVSGLLVRLDEKNHVEQILVSWNEIVSSYYHFSPWFDSRFLQAISSSIFMKFSERMSFTYPSFKYIFQTTSILLQVK